MVDLYTRKEIEIVSMDILRQSKSLDIFPTPVDKIVHFSDLIIDEKVDLSYVDRSFLEKFAESVSINFVKVLKQVRGFLDRSEKTIYLDMTQLPQRRNFVKLHETGHGVLPWQREIMQYIDIDETLSHETKEAFEAEANYFASLTLFQHDRFNNEMNKLELSLKAGMVLAKKFGGSTHASLRRLVEQSNRRCALLVLNNNHSESLTEGIYCLKKNLFQSQRFTADFGELEIPDRLDYSWVFTQDYLSGKKFHEYGVANLKTKNGEINFNYHFFNNSYNSFYFILPQGEQRKANTRIIINGF